MSGQQPQPQPPPPPSSMPQQPQPFRFWLPYRSNVASSTRHQPRPSSRPMPASPRPQPPPPPPPSTPAEHARRASPAPAMAEDVPFQADSSDESDTVPVQALDSSQRRGARPSMADLELTLPRPPSTSQERSSSRGDDRGNDTKISISGFPRSRLFDGARAPYRREIEDGIKSLAARETAAPPRQDGGQGYRVITLAGHNIGASMVLVGGGARETPLPTPRAGEPGTPESSATARPPAVAANVNSNVQSVNNSAMEGSTCSAGEPGVRVDVKNAHEEPVVVAPRQEEKPKESARRPPQEEKAEAARGGADTTAKPARARRCLRALMMENGSDAASTRKPKPSACRFQCVADHAPAPAAASNGGAGAGAGGGENAEEGGK